MCQAHRLNSFTFKNKKKILKSLQVSELECAHTHIFLEEKFGVYNLFSHYGSFSSISLKNKIPNDAWLLLSSLDVLLGWDFNILSTNYKPDSKHNSSSSKI